MDFYIVIAGLDPAIHAGGSFAYAAWFVSPRFCMDHRVKPGGDEVRKRGAQKLGSFSR
jgi:hypothetical protein